MKALRLAYKLNHFGRKSKDEYPVSVYKVVLLLVRPLMIIVHFQVKVVLLDGVKNDILKNALRKRWRTLLHRCREVCLFLFFVCCCCCCCFVFVVLFVVVVLFFVVILQYINVMFSKRPNAVLYQYCAFCYRSSSGLWKCLKGKIFVAQVSCLSSCSAYHSGKSPVCSLKSYDSHVTLSPHIRTSYIQGLWCISVVSHICQPTQP